MYQKFVTEVKELLQEQLGNGYELTIQSIIKVNDTQLCGIMISNKETNICPIIYMEQYYQQYLNGMVIEDIIKCIMTVHEENKCETSCDFDFFHWNTVKNKIVMKLINLKSNEEYLKNVAYIPFHDLAIVFCVLVEMDTPGIATTIVKNEFLNVWNVTKEEIYEIAKENTPKLFSYDFFSVGSILEEFMEIKDKVYILTNEFRIFGASCILYDGMLEMIRQELGKDFFLIPSSIHEWVIVPNDLYDEETFNEMIKEVNETSLKEDEILGTHCYYYDSAKKELK